MGIDHRAPISFSRAGLRLLTRPLISSIGTQSQNRRQMNLVGRPRPLRVDGIALRLQGEVGVSLGSVEILALVEGRVPGSSLSIMSSVIECAASTVSARSGKVV